MLASQIPAKFQIAFGASAGVGFIRPIPQASQIGITPGAASLTDGFPPLNFIATAAGGIPPYGQDFNGILNQITLWNQWQAAGGLAFYDSVFSTAVGGYPKGAVLASTTAGQAWLNGVDNNTTNPDAGGSNWYGFVFAVPGSAPKLNQFILAAGGTQAIPTSTITKLTDLAVSSSVPSDAVFNAGTGQITFGPKTAGTWAYNLFFNPSQTTSAATTTQVLLYHNNAQYSENHPSGTLVSLAGTVVVANGDTIDMRAWQNSGHNQTDIGPASPGPSVSFFNCQQLSS